MSRSATIPRVGRPSFDHAGINYAGPLSTGGIASGMANQAWACMHASRLVHLQRTQFSRPARTRPGQARCAPRAHAHIHTHARAHTHTRAETAGARGADDRSPPPSLHLGNGGWGGGWKVARQGERRLAGPRSRVTAVSLLLDRQDWSMPWSGASPAGGYRRAAADGR